MSRKTLKALETLPATNAAFIEPMECLATAKLPDGPQWVWEIKLDGYRALTVKNASNDARQVAKICSEVALDSQRICKGSSEHRFTATRRRETPKSN